MADFSSVGGTQVYGPPDVTKISNFSDAGGYGVDAYNQALRDIPKPQVIGPKEEYYATHTDETPEPDVRPGDITNIATGVAKAARQGVIDAGQMGMDVATLGTDRLMKSKAQKDAEALDRIQFAPKGTAQQVGATTFNAANASLGLADAPNLATSAYNFAREALGANPEALEALVKAADVGKAFEPPVQSPESQAMLAGMGRAVGPHPAFDPELAEKYRFSGKPIPTERTPVYQSDVDFVRAAREHGVDEDTIQQLLNEKNQTRNPVRLERDEYGNITGGDGRHRIIQALKNNERVQIHTQMRDGSTQVLSVDPKVAANVMGVTPSSLALTDAQQASYNAAAKGLGDMALEPKDIPNFRKWFGKSTIVDAQGNPRVVYHGTRAGEDFEHFSTEGRVSNDEGEYSTSGSGADPTAYMGAHFAKEPEVANKFARGEGWMRSRYEAEGKAGPRVIPAYLKLESPKQFGSERNLRQFIYEGDASRAGYAGGAMIDEAMHADGIEPESEEAEQWMEKYQNDAGFRAEQNRWMLENYSPQDEETSPDELAQELAMQAKSKLRKMGHDGAVYKNEVEGGTSYIAFEPNQIKHALSTKK